MRILFISTTSQTAYAFILPFAKYLREKNYDCSFACSSDSFPDAPCRLKELRDADFLVHEIPIPRPIKPLQDWKALWLLVDLIRTNNYDIIHTHTAKSSLLGLLAAKIAGCSLTVYHAHDFIFRGFNQGLKRQFYLFLERLTVPLADVILFVSNAVRQDALKFNFKPENKLILVGNGINCDNFINFEFDKQALRKQYNIKEDQLIVGTLGRLIPFKGIDVLIRAAAIVLEKHPNVRFLIAGDGPLRTELEALADSLKISDQVQFLGYLPDEEDVKKFMSILDLFVLPTRREGLGLVYVEAMALGCPVIGSKIAPVTEVIEDELTGLLAKVDDPQDFAQAINKLLENPDLRLKMSQASPVYVQSKFDLQRVYELTETVYLNFLNHKTIVEK